MWYKKTPWKILHDKTLGRCLTVFPKPMIEPIACFHLFEKIHWIHHGNRCISRDVRNCQKKAAIGTVFDGKRRKTPLFKRALRCSKLFFRDSQCRKSYRLFRRNVSSFEKKWTLFDLRIFSSPKTYTNGLPILPSPYFALHWGNPLQGSRSLPIPEPHY